MMIVVDHKPLLGLLKKRELGDISNPRLAKLTEKTMRWEFRIQHLAGKLNLTSDALSRLPGKLNKNDDVEEESGLIGVIDSKKLSITIDDVKKESVKDEEIKSVMNLLQTSLNKSSKEWGQYSQYFRFRHQLWQENGVLFIGKKMVIPRSLRREFSRCCMPLIKDYQE